MRLRLDGSLLHEHVESLAHDAGPACVELLGALLDVPSMLRAHHAVEWLCVLGGDCHVKDHDTLLTGRQQVCMMVA